ncbi:SDR family NAD(P)-dependent oxidoreductase [Candidatus Soleaferrea massiliensis]|uniref:SDR family NAD(P)-dependent oxidoreductase n=1 Tax=Candidatus Soleaferrea massiliensis TaxID=1470354 RepID=UPI0018CCD2ED|nr:SDR family NAD(P)-dependent oxidoreductase [Candidatus Soleaferrea massiliensis]
MLLEKHPGYKNALAGKTVLLTGAGGGIGFEAAKAFAYMGASVIIAEIDEKKGTAAAKHINDCYPQSETVYYQVDLSDDTQVRAMAERMTERYGFIDILFHNATMTALGNVEEVPIEIWDQSFRVNFRAPLLLTQLFLPEMKRRGRGVIVFVPSSGAAPYMGAYEVFKTAQVELCSTLAAELEETGVFTYSIGPGLVKTATAERAIEIVADRMGMTVDAFYGMNESHMLDAGEAGCGFAVSVLSARNYHGQEIGSIQALLDSGLLQEDAAETREVCSEQVLPFIQKMVDIFEEQYAGWMRRNIFERQWVLRDFKKTVGMSADQFRDRFAHMQKRLCEERDGSLLEYGVLFEKLRLYFQRQYKLLQGFEKNPEKLKEHSAVLMDWVDTLDKIVADIH